MNTFLNYLADSVLVSGLILGSIGFMVLGAIVVWRVFGGALRFIERNAR